MLSKTEGIFRKYPFPFFGLHDLGSICMTRFVAQRRRQRSGTRTHISGQSVQISHNVCERKQAPPCCALYIHYVVLGDLKQRYVVMCHPSRWREAVPRAGSADSEIRVMSINVYQRPRVSTCVRDPHSLHRGVKRVLFFSTDGQLTWQFSIGRMPISFFRRR